MPVIDLETPRLNTALPSVVPGRDDLDRGSDSPQQRPSWSSTFGAAFRQDNTVGAYFAREDKDSPTFREPGFRAWEGIKGTKYEEHWDSFVDVRNTRALEDMKRKIDREGEDRKLLSAAPWWQSVPAQMIAGTLDLPTLLPGGAFVRGAKGGFSILRSAANVGAAAGISSLAQETALQNLVETRTIGESGVNVGASVILGGILGAAGARLLSGAEMRAGVQAIERELAGDTTAPVMTSEASVGAAANVPASIEANTIAGRAAGALTGATAQLNPLLRSYTSPSAVYRSIFGQTAEGSIYLKKNFDGVASDVAAETLMKEWNGGLASSLRATDEAFSAYKKGGGDLSRHDFREAVGKAMRRGDTDAIPEVAKVAQAWRSNIFDPLKEAAIKNGLLPEDVTVETAASYFTRLWNRNKLIAREGEFKGIVERWVGEESPKWIAQHDRATERRLDPLRREIDELEMSKLRRAEEARAREAEGGEVTAGEFNEADIRSALRIVQGGAPKPKGVKTLTQFIREAGGLVEYSGELRSLGINNRSLPGMIRTTRRPTGNKDPRAGGWTLDDMARHAWENGYFQGERPTVNEFLEALGDDFNKRRPVLRAGEQDAFKLQEYIDLIEQDLSRIGAIDPKGARFSTSEEVKGIVGRVYQALDAEADRKIGELRAKLKERETEARVDREARFPDDPRDMARTISSEVFDKLTGRHGSEVRPDFITVNARGPLKERTFNIPDHLVEDFLESDIDVVGRRYTRIMGADVELANKFGRPDMQDQIRQIREDYGRLREGVTNEKELRKLSERERSDITDLETVRDLLRGIPPVSKLDNFAHVTRIANHVNYLRSMGEVVLASLTDAVRPAMVHGLGQFMTDIPQLLTNLKGVRLSVREAELAGNVSEQVLGHRLGTFAEILDPYSSRGPIESFMENMTNVASRWNGIRIWTDAMKSVASMMTQNRILRGVENFAKVKDRERSYLAFLGIDQSMAERIAAQFATHGETVDKVRVANTEEWTDAVAVRAYRAALNKDVDSIIVQKSVADVPLFAYTPTGRAVLQFKSFMLASHQKILLRGLQEDQARFIGGVVAMTGLGMFSAYMKALSGNRTEKTQSFSDNPGWWIAEGLDKSGVLGVPMELSNMFEKASATAGAKFNPIKAPITAFDRGDAISQKNQNREFVGSLLGPSAGLIEDSIRTAGSAVTVAQGEERTQAQKNAAERLLPFNSYAGMRQILRYVVNPPN